MSTGGYRRCLVCLTVCFGSLLVLWAVLVPGFRAPDEPQHVNSVMRLATGGGWPEPGRARLSDATVLAMREAGFVVPGPAVSVLPRGTLEASDVQFAEIVPVPPEQRSVLDHTAELQDDIRPSFDQMTQHPPLYYALGAMVVRAFGALDWRWDQQLLLLRLLNCLLTTAAIPLVAATARQLTGSRPVALTAAAGLLAIGQFAHVNAAVSNDALTTVLAMTSTYLAARALTRPHGMGLAVLGGAVLGLGLLTKGFLLAAIPMVALAFLLTSVPTGPGRDRHSLHVAAAARRWATTAVALATAFAVGGWWWLRNVLVHGAVQPSGMPERREVVGGDETPTLGEFTGGALDRLNSSFWGNFGWLELPLPPWVTASLGVVLVGLVAGSIAVAKTRKALLVLLTFPIGTGAVVILAGADAYYELGLLPGLQGRYFFSGLTVMLPAAAICATALARRLAQRWAGPLPAAALVVALLSAAFALVTFLQGAYQPWDETLLDALVRWDAWSPLSRLQVGLVVAALVMTAALTLVAYSSLGARSSRAGRDAAGAPRFQASPGSP